MWFIYQQGLPFGTGGCARKVKKTTGRMTKQNSPDKFKDGFRPLDVLVNSFTEISSNILELNWRERFRALNERSKRA